MSDFWAFCFGCAPEVKLQKNAGGARGLPEKYLVSEVFKQRGQSACMRCGTTTECFVMAKRAAQSAGIQVEYQPLVVEPSKTEVPPLETGLPVEDDVTWDERPEGEEVAPLTFENYEVGAQKTAIYPCLEELTEVDPERKAYFKEHPTPNPYYAALGLAGEVGEICNKVKKIMRDHGGIISDKTRADLADELGDALWYWNATCLELGVDPTAVARANLDKLAKRAEEGKLKGDGDKR